MFDSSSRNVIKKNSTSGNGEAGIAVLDGSNAFGVILSASEANYVMQNVASDNSIAGIVLVASGKNRIEENSVSGNGEIGIAVLRALPKTRS